MAILTFAGTELPPPSKLDYEGQQLVDSARNANGEVVAQKINRRQVKLNITWNLLYPNDIKTILNAVEQFSGTVHYFDLKEGSFINREMYWGDYKASTYCVLEDSTPKMLTAVTCSLVDMGLNSSTDTGTNNSEV